MDDRAAGDDALVLVPVLQSARSRPSSGFAGLRELHLSSSPTRPSGRRWPTRSCWSFWVLVITVVCGIAARAAARPADSSGRGIVAPAGHRAVLRHADGERAGLEEHADASGATACSPCIARSLGLPADRLVRRLPAALGHPHRRLAVAALRHCSSCSPRSSRSTASRRKRPRWTAPGRSRCSSISSLPHLGRADHRRHPDRDDLPARRSSPRSSSRPRAARACASTNLAFLIYLQALLRVRRRRRLRRRRDRGHPRQHRRLLPGALDRQEPRRLRAMAMHPKTREKLICTVVGWLVAGC